MASNAGRRGEARRRYRGQCPIEFKKFGQKIDTEVPAEFDVHVVLDNASTHKIPAVKTLGSPHTFC